MEIVAPDMQDARRRRRESRPRYARDFVVATVIPSEPAASAIFNIGKDDDGAAMGRKLSDPRVLALVDDVLARAERTEEGWCFAELLRKKAELLGTAGRHEPRPALRRNQARRLPSAVYRRFSEGFGTADLVAAKALLDTLRS